ncbi:MAG: hypothetical protein KKG76_05275 [Euryarchaeota archaeon]|nr:hypothetical protein [Euryarchaeota archaeon]
MILIPAIWELLRFYDMSRCKFKMANASERNNVIKLLLMKDMAGVGQEVAK